MLFDDLENATETIVAVVVVAVVSNEK